MPSTITAITVAQSHPPNATGPLERPREPYAATATAGRWSSIERQLPLLILGLLAPSIAILAVSVHTEVRYDLLKAEAARLQGSAGEVAALFGVGVSGRQRLMQRVAARADIVGWVSEPDRLREEDVRSTLLPYLRRNVPSVAELWSLDGHRLLRVTSPGQDDAPVPPLHVAELPAPKGLGYQPLQMLGTEPYSELVVEVRPRAEEGGTSPPAVGHLTIRQGFTGGQAAELLARLIGKNVTLTLGNADGSLWTDLVHEVPPPPHEPKTSADPVFVNAAGVLRVGAKVAIENTPWMLLVESDAAPALAPLDRLLLVMTAVAGVLLLLGAGGARWISRRITAPLRAATEAAEAIAAGHYDRRLVLQRRDEVGRLTLAFNTMAGTVEQTRAEQDELVARKTAELTRALRHLREAQDDLVRQEKLALLGQLAGSVGHELRNPLGVMTNAIFYLEMVLDEAAPEVREYLGILRRQVSLSEKITSDLLDFTRHRAPNVEHVDMAGVVTEQLARLGPVRVDVECLIPPDLPAALADAVQIGQVVFNLLTNAVQATETLHDGALQVECTTSEGRVRLEVRDNGPGVPAAVRDKIFEPLFTTRARGIGLGLSVSCRLAEANGGSLTLAPASERGATFVLDLPAADGGSR